MMRIIWIALIAVLFRYTAKAQHDTSSYKASFTPLPVVFYTPETRWGFGAASIYNFKFKGEPDSSTASQLQFGFAYTLNKQLLVYLPFRLYYSNENYIGYGEVGYYKYFFRYYGIGNNIDVNDFETYDVIFPRLRLNVLKKTFPNLYIGGRYIFDGYDMVEVEPGGKLDNSDVLGRDGGIISGLGVVSNFDTRDNIFFPRKGVFLETVVLANQTFLGSDFNYVNYVVDFSKYFTINKNHVLALNAFGNFNSGNPPFFQLALLGGTKKMRGYFEGTYRDKNLLLSQIEYRLPLFWRFGMVAFGSYGAVAPSLSQFQINQFRYTYGAGIRFRLNDDGVNVRLDAAFSKNTSGFYLTFLEAF